MRSLYIITALLSVSVIAPVAVPASAQKISEQDCLGTMHGDTCEMTSDQNDAYVRHRDWNANIKRNEEADAERRQMSAEAHTRAENGKMSRFQELMRKRRESAKAAGN